MEIRRYQEEDDVEQVIQNATTSVEPKNYSREQQEHLENVIPEMNLDFAEKDRYIYFVAAEDGEIIGLAGFQRESGTLAGIFVEPEHMGEGIGSQLLEKIENEADKKGVEEMESLASLEAVEFYRKNGYEVVDERDQNIEGKDIGIKVMTKEL
jgi:putative acetyltransferase